MNGKIKEVFLGNILPPIPALDFLPLGKKRFLTLKLLFWVSLLVGTNTVPN